MQLGSDSVNGIGTGIHTASTVVLNPMGSNTIQTEWYKYKGETADANTEVLKLMFSEPLAITLEDGREYNKVEVSTSAYPWSRT